MATATCALVLVAMLARLEVVMIVNLWGAVFVALVEEDLMWVLAVVVVVVGAMKKALQDCSWYYNKSCAAAHAQPFLSPLAIQHFDMSGHDYKK